MFRLAHPRNCKDFRLNDPLWSVFNTYWTPTLISNFSTSRDAETSLHLVGTLRHTIVAAIVD